MKKIMTIAICAMLLAGTQAQAVSDWAISEAHEANKRGLVTHSLLWGSITENITREEFCYLAMNLYKNMGGEGADTRENPFTDTENPAVIEAYNLGIINGKTATEFYPNAPITRQEIAKIIMLTVNNLTERGITEKEICEVCQFDDFNDVHEWAIRYVEDAVKSNIINGYSPRYLFPQGNATREQAIAIMNRAYENFSPMVKDYAVPQVDYPENGEVKGDEVSVSWSHVMGAHSYSVILRDKDKNVLSTQVTWENKYTLPVKDLAEGEYSIIVGAKVGDFADVYSPEITVKKISDKNTGSGSAGEGFVDKYPTQQDKLRRIFPDGQPYTDKETAVANMRQVKVPVWKLNKNGEKYPSEATLEINANLAEDVVSIFTEIFNDPERFPIKNLGGFSWRNTASGSVSEHSYGTCIDINWEENYYCYAATGEAITGNYWKPYEDPYSIPAESSVVRIFKKYGFKWGGDAWTTLRDYMHFTYLGR
ncbi:MAG: hypothetical protein E7417_03635 [Ruminococcaceae bacterium]|nr:hypothetical protein [Oscillospiraceae bacterium]